MKKLLLSLAIFALATSCEDKNQVLDPLAKLAINAPEGSKTETNPKYKTPREVIELTTTFVLENFEYAPDEDYVALGISDQQKDYVNMRILMEGIDVIKDDALSPVIIEGEHFILTTRINQETGEVDPTKPISDTLAYVPNAQLRAVEPLIKAAYEAGEYDQMYEMFQNSLTFIPINGEDFAKLKAEGRN